MAKNWPTKSKGTFSPAYSNVQESQKAGERDPGMPSATGRPLSARELQVQPAANRWTAKTLMVTPKGKK